MYRSWNSLNALKNSSPGCFSKRATRSQGLTFHENKEIFREDIICALLGNHSEDPSDWVVLLNMLHIVVDKLAFGDLSCLLFIESDKELL